MKVLLAVLMVVAAATANQCPKEQEADWNIEKLLRHEDCEKFYKCTYGEPVVQFCPVGLYFNLDLWQCDWQKNVDCGDRNIPGVDKPEPEPVPEPEPESEAEAEPENEPEPEPVPEPEESQESDTEEPIPEPEIPTEVPESEESEECDSEEPETEEPTTEEPITNEPEPEESEEVNGAEFLPNGCPVDPHTHWLLPHEYDCNAFYYCVWGEKVLRHCSSSLHFNRELQVCDWPWDAGCPVALNKHYAVRTVFRA